MNLQRKHPRPGRAVFWPRDIEARYAISGPTRTRWERTHRLPARDFYLDGRPVGWLVDTITTAERSPQSSAAMTTATAAA